MYIYIYIYYSTLKKSYLIKSCTTLKRCVAQKCVVQLHARALCSRTRTTCSGCATITFAKTLCTTSMRSHAHNLLTARAQSAQCPAHNHAHNLPHTI